MGLSLEDGTTAVALARETIEAHVGGESIPPKNWTSGPLSERRGVFVTLNLDGPLQATLRGCIGFAYPVKALGSAIQEAAVAAASEDPRFPPVSRGEVDKIVVEVSVLTPPADLEAPRRQDLPSKVRIGVDGLIVSDSTHSGLLLPQVATDFPMDQVEFLSQTCLKAGLPPDSWLDKETKVQVFQAEIFTEARPRGEVVRVRPRES